MDVHLHNVDPKTVIACAVLPDSVAHEWQRKNGTIYSSIDIYLKSATETLHITMFSTDYPGAHGLWGEPLQCSSS